MKIRPSQRKEENKELVVNVVLKNNWSEEKLKGEFAEKDFSSINPKDNFPKAYKYTESIYQQAKIVKKYEQEGKKDEFLKQVSEREVKDIWNKYFSTSRILKRISEILKKDEGKKVKDIYSLLYREDFIVQAITKLRPNKGTGTPGIDKGTLDEIGTINLALMMKQLKDRNYKFQPVKRIIIPKPGKKPLRPLGIPTFNDRIIQEMIRNVLEHIYEPVFENYQNNVNYGFRPGKSTQQAIQKLKLQAQNMEWCIEGDIKGAYDNVNHKILIEILSERIEDKELLGLIGLGLRCGSIQKGKYEHSLLGTPQGGIAFPILFNIYMSKFDEFISDKINSKIKDWNTEEERKLKPVTNKYRKYESTITSSKKVLQRIKKIENEAGRKTFNEWSQASKDKYNVYYKRFSEARNLRIEVPYLDKKKALIRWSYVRYADDWVFFTNASKEKTNIIKEMISEYLSTNLKLTLSEEKTKITNVKKDKVNFLGFSLSYYADRIRMKKLGTIRKGEMRKGKGWTVKINKNSISHVKRTTGNRLIIGIDQKRLEDRMKVKRFMDKTGNQGSRKPEWAVLSDYEIVLRYNYVIRGLITYYSRSVRNFTILNKYIYILNYSCAHTLANKHNSSVRRIFTEYGKPIKVKQTTDKEEKTLTIIDYTEMKRIANELQLGDKEMINDDILNVRVNWRTI